MKNLIVILVIFISASVQSQTLTEIYSKYIQPSSNTEELKEGLTKIEKLCKTNPQEKCNKAKASALYLMADNYYSEARQVYKVDTTLVQPILLKANELFNKASEYMPITAFTENQKNTMLNDKNYFEALVN